jgi:hypothetical protein
LSTLVLERRAYLPKGTFGQLHFPEGQTIWTLENPWKNNVPFVSCIPEGLYGLTRDTFKDRYPNYRIVNPPPGRWGIEIHRGNNIEHTSGCILVGMDLGSQWNIMNSEEAMDWTMELLEDTPHPLLYISHFQPQMGLGEL